MPIVTTPGTTPTDKKVQMGNLNVGMVDGYNANATPTANNIPVLDANALLPYSTGWFPIPTTLAYSTVDGHTFVVTTNSVDLTSYIGLGDRIKFTNNSTTFYGIVTAISSTTITLYGGTQYAVANSAITAPFFSHWKTPLGFLVRPDYWTESLSDTSLATQNTPTANTVYNLGSLSLAIPIGVWDLSFYCQTQLNTTNINSAMTAGLSTTNNSFSDGELASRADESCGTNPAYPAPTLTKRKTIVLTSKTTYYLNAVAWTAASVLYFRGDTSLTTTKITASCAYL